MTHEFLAYQLIILFVAILLILRTLLQVLKRKKEVRELFLAVLIWGTFAVLALFPNLSQFIAHLFGFELGINFLLTISILILSAAVINLIVRADKNNSAITQMVRAIALQEIKKDN